MCGVMRVVWTRWLACAYALRWLGEAACLSVPCDDRASTRPLPRLTLHTPTTAMPSAEVGLVYRVRMGRQCEGTSEDVRLCHLFTAERAFPLRQRVGLRRRRKGFLPYHMPRAKRSMMLLRWRCGYPRHLLESGRCRSTVSTPRHQRVRLACHNEACLPSSNRLVSREVFFQSLGARNIATTAIHDAG
jgi:hypothetical protein